MPDDRLTLAIAASLAAGLSTGLGAVPVLVVQVLSAAWKAAMLGFASGVMLAASAFSLLGTAFELLGPASAGAATLQVGGSFLLGSLSIYAMDRALPHEHFVKGREGPPSSFVRGAWLFVLAIGLHNLPEGLAVGVGFSAPSIETGYVISLGIVTQNLPEGLIAAVSLRAVGYGRGFSLAVAAATGLVETAAGLLGCALSQRVEATVPLAMAFAAGAMVYVVGQEVLPESHVQGRSRIATWGLVTGFLLMTLLDRLLG